MIDRPVPSSPEPLHSAPEIAGLSDAFAGRRDDLDVFMSIAQEVGARSVLDVGCGTGEFALYLGRAHIPVVAIDPVPASIDVAKQKSGADQVTWVCADAQHMPGVSADFATMTGHVAMVFLTDAEWAAVLAAIWHRLADRGHLAFDVRRADARAWEEWAESAAVQKRIPQAGVVTEILHSVSMDYPLTSFTHTYRYPDGSEVEAQSTLRYRSDEEICSSLETAGFDVIEARDAAHAPGRSVVYVAQKV